MKRTVWWIALLVVLVHGIWIQRVAVHARAGGADPYTMCDTESYVLAADQFFSSIPVAPVFRERMFYPLLLAVARQIGSDTTVLWLLLPLHGLSILAIAYIAGILSDKRWVPIGSALLYALNPSFYTYGVNLGTDVCHAQFAIVATAASMAWMKTGRRRWVIAAVLFWGVAQMTRQAFLPIAVALVPLWWGRLREPGTRLATVAALGATLAIPVFYVVSNAMVFGVPAPSFATVEALHRYVVPRMRMVQRHAENPGLELTPLWLDERERVALENEDYRALQLYRPSAASPDFRTHYLRVMESDMEIIRKDWGLFWTSGMQEVWSQASTPPSAPARVLGQADGPGIARQESLFRKGFKLSMALCLIGLAAAAARRHYGIVLFVWLFLAMTLLPSVLVWWLGGRMRLPAELVLMPFVVLALGSSGGWIFIAGTALLGYAPFKLFGLPELYLQVATASFLLVGLGAALRDRGNTGGWLRAVARGCTRRPGTGTVS